MLLFNELSFFFTQVVLKSQHSLASNYDEGVIFHLGVLLVDYYQTGAKVEYGLFFTRYIMFLPHCWHMFLVFLFSDLDTCSYYSINAFHIYCLLL